MPKTRSFKKAFNKADEYYTPRCLVEPVIPYLDKLFNGNRSKVIYCPFDTELSEYVICLKEAGYTVIYGDIKTGQDFFEKPIPDNADIVISNPPFSCKLKVFEKCFYSNKPFMLLMNLMAINYQDVTGLFEFWERSSQTPVQLLIFDKKVSFNGNTSSFNSSYITWKVLDRTTFCHLENNNSGKYYEPATAYKKQGDII